MENLAVKDEKTLALEKQRIEDEKKTREILKKMINEGKLPEARSLTRGERKKLDAEGLNIRKYNYNRTDKTFDEVFEDMCDWILDNIYPDFDFDQIENNLARIFAVYVFGLTYKDNLAEKN